MTPAPGVRASVHVAASTLELAFTHSTMSVSTNTASDEQLFELLGRHNLLITLARLAVLRAIAQVEPHHLSIEQLCAAMDKIQSGLGFSTFRTAIYDLASAGVLERVVIPHGKRGRTLLYELTGKPTHRHLYCQVCHRIEEVIDTELESRIAACFVQIGFRPATIDYGLPGRCASCAAPASGA